MNAQARFCDHEARPQSLSVGTGDPDPADPPIA